MQLERSSYEYGVPKRGQWNYDKMNREALPVRFDAPQVPTFEPDEVTRAVIAEMKETQGIGSVEDFTLPVTHEQAQVFCIFR